MTDKCKGMLRLFLTAMLCSMLCVFFTPAIDAAPNSSAFAVTTEIDAEPDDLQRLIEESNEAYESASARVAELESAISESEARIVELEALLPEQRERGGDAMRELYKIQRGGSSLVDLILTADNFMDFVSRVDFLDRVFDRHFDDLEALSAMVDELNEAQSQLQADLADAHDARERASQSLADAQAAREQAQREARAKAEEEARLAQQAVSEQDEQEAQDAEASQPDADVDGGSQEVVPPSGDGADWSSDKMTFVSAWAGRIDSYLAGSPLSGQGATFAAAAWDYGVDPRFSPAISCVESSKGAACFLPYNAWGWGSVSWGSWEEAIDAHVRGLARGYGYTLSEAAAKKYCPPNWQHWHSRVGEEMGRI